MFSRSKPELGIAFHIGTASVGAALIRFKRGKAPEILYTLREHIPYRESVDPDRFAADMIAALKSANARFSHLAEPIKRVFYVFSSPWTVTQASVDVLKQKKKSSKLNSAQVGRILAKEDRRVVGAPAGLAAIERKVTGVRLNGQHHIEVSSVTTYIPEDLFDKIMAVSARTYHPKHTQTFSTTLASFFVIRGAFPTETNFISLDIGGEISDATIVKKGLIAETVSFPVGRHIVTRRLRAALGVSAEQASSLATLYEEGRADSTLEAKLKPIIEAAVSEWERAFRAAVRKADGKSALPARLFVIVNDDLAKLFVRTLRAEENSVTLVNHAVLKTFADIDRTIDRDPFITLIAAFAGRVYESEAK